MILPINYLWSQLNGPQVRGITEAIFQEWKTIFDDKLNYLNQLSVETANDDHLTLLGLLSGLIRPTITEADRDYFLFTETAEQGSTHGFAALDDATSGGRLTKTGTGQGTHNKSLDAEHYRTLLKAWISGDGEIGSLALLDDICYNLTKLDLGPGQEPFYKFKFMQGDDIPQDRAPGDVYIDMGSLAQWRNPVHIYAVLNGIANTVYAPQPRLFVSIGTTGRVTNPSATPGAGKYETSVTVTMGVNTDTASIYYTTDGGTPSASSTKYTVPITLTETTTLKMIGIAPDFGDSDVVTVVYTIK